MNASFLFYDLETLGSDPRRSRIAQFAAVRTDEALPRIDAPVLILHALGDEIVPISHGRELATANGATLVELDGSHNSGLSHQREYWRAIDEHVLAR